MRHLSLVAALAFIATPALAGGEIPFETTKGWDIERSPPGPNGSSCLMSKTYKDPDDNDAVNALVFALADDKAVMTFVYEHWTWDKNEKIRVPLMLDKRVAIAKSAWTGDGTSLTATVPATLVPNMLAAKKMILKLDGADADFDLAGFPEAYESLRRCDATPAQIVQAAKRPATPPESHIKTFYLGSMVEAAIKECDVPTNGRQRTAFDAKLAVLRKEMGDIEAQIRDAVAKRPEPRCPSEKDAPKLLVTIQDFIDKSPDEFMAAVEKRAADEAAGQPPKL
ncbi:hypothetical protein [uncultured Methylobacterium sp.]|uniref:hypothetical protein n=1 Tax=uncultured Methylobacterium sp. TaxID=157278 RepID=UPI0035CC07D1